MHENWGKSFFCPIDKKMSFPHIERYIEIYPGLCTVVFKTSTRYLKFMLYHTVIQSFWDTFDFFHFYAQPVGFYCALAHEGYPSLINADRCYVQNLHVNLYDLRVKIAFSLDKMTEQTAVRINPSRSFFRKR